MSQRNNTFVRLLCSVIIGRLGVMALAIAGGPSLGQALQDSTVTKEKFEQVIQAARSLYGPRAQDQGAILTIEGNWDSIIPDAFARRFFKDEMYLYVSGGMGMQVGMTQDAFALVVCHELGHLFGGEPTISGFYEFSVEGQADYYATQTCLPQVLALLNSPSLDEKEVPETMAAICSTASLVQPSNGKLCPRLLLASENLARVFAYHRGGAWPTGGHWDTTEVSKTLKSYPETVQCRLDTFWSGILGFSRPKCWYTGDVN